MFETSKDLLNWVLASSIALLTIFIIWGLYYVVMLLRRGYAIIRDVSDLILNIKEKLDRLESLFDTIEEKLKSSASYLPLVMKGITEILDYVKKKKESREARKTKKSSSAKES